MIAQRIIKKKIKLQLPTMTFMEYIRIVLRKKLDKIVSGLL